MLKEHQPTISETVSEEDASQKHDLILVYFTRYVLLTWIVIFTCDIKDLQSFFVKKTIFYDLFIKIEVTFLILKYR